MGNRIQSFSSDALEFIQPYLACLSSNQPYAGMVPRATTSYEQVVERRGAELIIRLASNIQYMKDCLNIIHEVSNADFFTCDQKFADESEDLINIKFGPPARASDEYDTTSTNIQTKLIITKDTCDETVNIFLKIFMPQHFIIMNHRMHNDTMETSYELDLQTIILNVKYRIFHKTSLLGKSCVLKNVDKDLLDHLLNQLVRRGILRKGNFLISAHSKKYESYIKYLSDEPLEQRQFASELKKHNILLSEYQQLYLISAFRQPVL